MSQNTKKHVVILGAGFGGLNAAKQLLKADCQVTLIDRNNHHLFQPLLYQVATAQLSTPDIAKSIRSTLPMDENVDVLMDEVMGIELDKKSIKLASGNDISYDYLIIGLGAVSGYFGNNHWAQYCIGLKSLEEAVRIRRRVLHAYEKAEVSKNPEEQMKLMTTVVVGGGPTGVEMSGSLIELARQVLKGAYSNIDPSKGRVILIEAAPKVLGTFADPLPQRALEALEELGVEVKLNSPVQNITANTVELKDETIHAENIIWAAGVQAPAITQTLGVPTSRGGQLLVEKDCSLPNHPEVFAIGDIVSMKDAADKPIPGVSPAAIQMGKHVAKLIKTELQLNKAPGEVKRPRFAYFDKGSMATIGRSKAIASFSIFKMTGLIAWLMWLFIHLLYLVGFKNKISVLLQWFYAYVNFQRGARIISGLTHQNKD